MSLCLIDGLVETCEGVTLCRLPEELEDLGPLLDALRHVPDPRGARGRRYPWMFLLAGTMLAVLCGAKSLAAAAQWIGEAPAELRERLGAGKSRHPMWVGTLSRPFSKIDADALDDILHQWLNTLHEVTEEPATGNEPLRGLAIVGKTARGAREGDKPAPHLLAALRHEDGTIAAQREVDRKTNEIKVFIPLLDTMNIKGMVITADQMHTQRDHAIYLKEREAYFLFTVGDNQPKLHLALLKMPWDKRRVAHRSVERAHGRIETRTIKVYRAPRGLLFPDVTVVFQVERRFTDLDGKPLSHDVVQGITSIPKRKATPAAVTRILRGHWGVEALHNIRDTTYAEDASRVRTGASPRVMATLRNISISTFRLFGWDNIAEATRYMSANPYDAATMIGLTS